MSIFMLFCILLGSLSQASMKYYKPKGNLKQLFGWKELDFKYSNATARQHAIDSGHFVPRNNIPVDVLSVKNRVFLTMPRFRKGIPATLATVPIDSCKKGHSCAPPLEPYPNWKWNNGEMGCDGLTSVFSVNIDKCGNLWVIDTGVIDIFASTGWKSFCPPQLLVFDTSNDRLIRRYTLSKKPNTLFVTVALDTLDTANNCKNTFAYVADFKDYGVMVVDAMHGKSWRVENRLFYPYPNWGRFTVAGESYDFMDGVLGLALHPKKNRLYFHSLSSARENYVSTKLLRNSSIANSYPENFYVSYGEKPSQAAYSAFDSRGILFFGLLGKNSLACYNPSQLHIPSNIIEVARDDVALQAPSGVKVSYYGFKLSYSKFLQSLHESFR